MNTVLSSISTALASVLCGFIWVKLAAVLARGQRGCQRSGSGLEELSGLDWNAQFNIMLKSIHKASSLTYDIKLIVLIALALRSFAGWILVCVQTFSSYGVFTHISNCITAMLKVVCILLWFSGQIKNFCNRTAWFHFICLWKYIVQIHNIHKHRSHSYWKLLS